MVEGVPHTIDIKQESSLARGALESFSNSILLRELISMLLLLYSDFNGYPQLVSRLLVAGFLTIWLESVSGITCSLSLPLM